MKVCKYGHERKDTDPWCKPCQAARSLKRRLTGKAPMRRKITVYRQLATQPWRVA